jgi:predicted nucleic acid-binding protein
VLLARENKARLAISQWVINECVGAAQRKKNNNELSKHEVFEILTGITDLIEGKIEEADLSIYPISEDVITSSRTTIKDMECNTASDALHVYVADKSGCNYFITADNNLAMTMKKNGSLIQNLIPININEPDDMSKFFSDFS